MSFRNRVRIVVGALLPAMALAGTAPAQETIKEGGETPPKGAHEAREIVLDVTPRGAPVPIFRHRLLPTATELNPGDAAPVYLRLGYELPDGALREADQKTAAWLGLTLDRFPAAEARKYVDGWSGRLRQIEFGSRRRACDWDYTVAEQKEHVIEILLPDLQAMRPLGRLLAVKARAEVAERKVDDAIRTIATGLAFSRHVASGPFYINMIVGVSNARWMLGAVDDLVGRPDAPNLYWALTALPRPLIGLREATETERAVVERMVPEVAEVDRPRTDGEWAALLARLHARMLGLKALLWPEGKPLAHLALPPDDLGAFRAAMLPKARAYLKERRVEAASDDQAIVLAVVGSYRELYDDYFKGAYLPYPDAVALDREVEARVGAAKAGPASMFTALLPAVQSVHLAEVGLDRKVAALRAVEALRLHADAHGGRLPESLDAVKAVPVPDDPMTGKPFEYRREGESAVLTGPAAAAFRLVYRITIRK